MDSAKNVGRIISFKKFGMVRVKRHFQCMTKQSIVNRRNLVWKQLKLILVLGMSLRNVVSIKLRNKVYH